MPVENGRTRRARNITTNTRARQPSFTGADTGTFTTNVDLYTNMYFDSIVETASGSLSKKKFCKRIDGEWYKRGKVSKKESGECFRIKVEGKFMYLTLESGRVIWDEKKKKYVEVKIKPKKAGKKVLGIIGTNMEMGEMIKSNSNVFVYYKGRKTNCVNEKTAILNGYKERLEDAVFYKKTEFKPSFFTEKVRVDQDYKQGLDYGCERYMEQAKYDFEKLFEIIETDTQIERLYRNNTKIFDTYTFGLEFETVRGTIPQHICKRLGLMPLRDGSIEGIEYVTIPLTGKDGLYALKYIFKEISKRTEFNNSCSMHIHVGGFKRTNKNILALFKMLYNVQNSVYDLFPMYKKKNMGVKRQDYTAPLPDNLRMKMDYNNENDLSIKNDIGRLIYYLSGNTTGYEKIPLKDIKMHPRNTNNNRKWNMTARYLWVNLIPVIFTNKQTVEFRIFGMPNTEMKLFAFLTMSLGLVEFSTSNSSVVLEDGDSVIPYSNITRLLDVTISDKNILSYFRDRLRSVSDLNRKKGLNYEEKHIT